MEKRQFLTSFIANPESSTGHILASVRVIAETCDSIVKKIPDPDTRARAESDVHEVLLRAWMFDAVFNGDWDRKTDLGEDGYPLWPLVAIYLFGEPFFVNPAYCYATGLSPAEIRTYVRTGHLYDEVYADTDAEKAREWVRKLQAGKWYRDLGLSMKHIHRTTYWNSYGGGAEDMEIRVGRDIPNHDEIHDDFYQGNVMNSVSILESLYEEIVRTTTLTPVERSKMFWIAEYLSLFDFLWNHGGFALECVFVDREKNGSERVSGHYNPVYAGLLEQSFQGQQSFGKIFPAVYGAQYRPTPTASEWFGLIDRKGWIPIFRRKHRRAIAEIFWRHISCDETCLPDRPILGVGIARPLHAGYAGWWRRLGKWLRISK